MSTVASAKATNRNAVRGTPVRLEAFDIIGDLGLQKVAIAARSSYPDKREAFTTIQTNAQRRRPTVGPSP
jgi:hypothetical protein